MTPLPDDYSFFYLKMSGNPKCLVRLSWTLISQPQLHITSDHITGSPITRPLFRVQLDWDNDDAGDILVALLPEFIINMWPPSSDVMGARGACLSHLDLRLSTCSFYGFSRTGIQDGAHRAPERFLMIRVGWAWNQDRTCGGHVKPGPTSNGPRRIGFVLLKVKKKMNPADRNEDIT